MVNRCRLGLMIKGHAKGWRFYTGTFVQMQYCGRASNDVVVGLNDHPNERWDMSCRWVGGGKQYQIMNVTLAGRSIQLWEDC